MRLFAFLIASLALAPLAVAEVELRVSIKVILGPGGEWPDNTSTVGTPALNLNSAQVLRDNLKFANEILAREGTGYRFVLRDNQIYSLSGFANSWFTLDARQSSSRDLAENTATANSAAKVLWQWHDDSINIYVNDSRSGYCSGPGSGKQVILVGAGAYSELIIHEIGHYFSLAHTHTVDNDSALDDWADGDGLGETLPDDADATQADINNRYDGNPQPLESQVRRDDLIFNIMSYRDLRIDRFVWDQRERIIETFNSTRAFATIGHARFVQPGGNNGADGLTIGSRLATIGRGVDLAAIAQDAVLIRGGSYNATSEGLPLTITKAVTLVAWRGAVTITRSP